MISHMVLVIALGLIVVVQLRSLFYDLALSSSVCVSAILTLATAQCTPTGMRRVCPARGMHGRLFIA